MHSYKEKNNSVSFQQSGVASLITFPTDFIYFTPSHFCIDSAPEFNRRGILSDDTERKQARGMLMQG